MDLSVLTNMPLFATMPASDIVAIFSGLNITQIHYKKDDMLAEQVLFGKGNRFPVQITAREDVTALIIAKQSVLSMLSKSEIVLKNYLDISADFAARLSNKLHFMKFRTIRQKIAMYILNLSKIQQSETIILDKTKSALAEYFGVSRQSLERELSNMQQEKLIVVHKKEIVIPNKENLVQMIRF